MGSGKENNVSGKEESALEGLFVEDKKSSWKSLVDIRDDGRAITTTTAPGKLNSMTDGGTYDSEEPEPERFNESAGSVKKRKVDPPVVGRKEKEHRGPFIDESDSDEDDNDNVQYAYNDKPIPAQTRSERSADQTPAFEPPPLVRAATSNFESSAVADDFDDIEDELEGSDSMERSWVEEERRAFEILQGDAIDDGPSCPICQASLVGKSDLVRFHACKLTG